MEGNLYQIIKKNLHISLNEKQNLAIKKISSFIDDKNDNNLFILKGYAGTGKTFIISQITKNLWKIKKSAILLGPTGRSAKVISSYCNKEAFTIHKEIFFTKNNFSGNLEFTLKINKHKHTLFIIDEASMISTDRNEAIGLFSKSLLDNLIKYVYTGFKCKLLIIGDTAQLPPVKSTISYALDTDFIESEYGKKVNCIELVDVARQESESGILHFATLIRNKIDRGFFDDISFNFDSFEDIIRVEDGEHMMNLIQDSYENYGLDETAIIVRSNKRANLYNQAVRDKILNNENLINSGDLLMVVKNNYFWLKNKKDISFIANGDIIRIEKIFNIKNIYGFKFANVKISMVDYPKIKPFETVLILDSIYINGPALDFNTINKLYNEILNDYMNVKTKYKRHLGVKNNSYFNALQVKFAYSFTCHKSQGGQWESIFIEFPYLPNGMNEDFFRWLYTAITRAKNKLHLIGFNK
tara:strand:+ start:20005 stop:21411 length:1407 start_codon:yes stop_codon:yes gene_type:complete